MIAGSVVFLVGAAVGVPRVFTEPDPKERLRMLEARIDSWRIAQPLYWLGALVCAIGIGVLGADATGPGRALFFAAAAAAFGGALAWGWSLYVRGTRVSDFAFRRISRWPFATYVLLTIAGLALLGAGLVVAGIHPWLGWSTLGAGSVFLVLYLVFEDIPPFVFYLLLLLVGAVLI